MGGSGEPVPSGGALPAAVLSAVGGALAEQAVRQTRLRAVRTRLRIVITFPCSKARCIGAEDLELNASRRLDQPGLPIGAEQVAQLAMIVRAAKSRQHPRPVEVDLCGGECRHLVVLRLVGNLEVRWASEPLHVRCGSDVAHVLLDE